MPLVLPNPRAEYATSPGDHGLLAWSDPPEIANTSGSALTSGTLYGIRIQVPYTISVTNLWAYVTTLGATLTAGQSLGGLYTSAGVKIAQTADQSSSWTSTGIKTMALTGGPFVLAGGPGVFYYAALLSVGTTPPAFRGAAAAPIAGWQSLNQATGLGANVTTQASQTTIPSTFAPTANVTNKPWVGLS